jgi:hypothetical protein
MARKDFGSNDGRRFDIDVVEKRGEPFLLPLPGGLPHAVQRLGHTGSCEGSGHIARSDGGTQAGSTIPRMTAPRYVHHDPS